jgi:multidrug efflux pump subunit AcrA (membrane-fusion protein)
VLDGRSEGNVGKARKTVPVFVFDQSTNQVRVREIVVGDLRGNMLEVYSGLQPGDQVVSAGVPFLRDQMKVELWEPDEGLKGG